MNDLTPLDLYGYLTMSSVDEVVEARSEMASSVEPRGRSRVRCW